MVDVAAGRQRLGFWFLENVEVIMVLWGDQLLQGRRGFRGDPNNSGGGPCWGSRWKEVDPGGLGKSSGVAVFLAVGRRELDFLSFEVHGSSVSFEPSGSKEDFEAWFRFHQVK